MLFVKAEQSTSQNKKLQPLSFSLTADFLFLFEGCDFLNCAEQEENNDVDYNNCCARGEGVACGTDINTGNGETDNEAHNRDNCGADCNGEE